MVFVDVPGDLVDGVESRLTKIHLHLRLILRRLGFRSVASLGLGFFAPGLNINPLFADECDLLSLRASYEVALVFFFRKTGSAWAWSSFSRAAT